MVNKSQIFIHLPGQNCYNLPDSIDSEVFDVTKYHWMIVFLNHYTYIYVCNHTRNCASCELANMQKWFTQV